MLLGNSIASHSNNRKKIPCQFNDILKILISTGKKYRFL